MDSSAEVRIGRSLRKWRITALLAVLLLVASVLWSAYAAFDAGVTLAYHDDSLRNLQEAHALLERIALRVSASTTKGELLTLLQELGVESFEKEGAVHAGALSFYFTSGSALACITSTYPPAGTPCAPFFEPGP